MKRVKLFEYAVILQPKEDDKGNVIEKGEVIVERTEVLVENEQQAGMIAARSVPEEYMDKLERVEVVIRPF